MRAEPWLDETRHGINHAISFGCDYCATTRRRCDVVCWQILSQKPVEAGLEGVVSKVRDQPSRCGLICSDAVEGHLDLAHEAWRMRLGA
jgi:hypothetical protein